MSLSSVTPTDVPDGSLLAHYETDSNATTARNYCDCYSITISGKISLEEFVYAFYTSRLFRVERRVLSVALRIASSDEQAKQLSVGRTSRFAAWTVESRRDDEMLLRVLKSRTGSWFMVRPNLELAPDGTELLFGSVVLPGKNQAGLGLLFHALAGFHRTYSRALLDSARTRLIMLRASGH